MYISLSISCVCGGVRVGGKGSKFRVVNKRINVRMA